MNEIFFELKDPKMIIKKIEQLKSKSERKQSRFSSGDKFSSNSVENDTFSPLYESDICLFLNKTVRIQHLIPRKLIIHSES
jgi:hypothetical protein